MAVTAGLRPCLHRRFNPVLAWFLPRSCQKQITSGNFVPDLEVNKKSQKLTFSGLLADRVGFEPTVPLLVHLISSQGRYNHFDTCPYLVVEKGRWKFSLSGKRRLAASPSYGGSEGARTLDLRVANAALSQLSYEPKYFFCSSRAKVLYHIPRYL